MTSTLKLKANSLVLFLYEKCATIVLAAGMFLQSVFEIRLWRLQDFVQKTSFENVNKNLDRRRFNAKFSTETLIALMRFHLEVMSHRVFI